MPVQLFKLKGVPDDEAEDIRELLARNEIDFYETPAGNWGISMPAIWLNDETQLAKAQRLIERYEGDRAVRLRAEYDRLKEEGGNKTIIDAIKEHPIRFVSYLLIIAAVIYLSIKPFMAIGG